MLLIVSLAVLTGITFIAFVFLILKGISKKEWRFLLLGLTFLAVSVLLGFTTSVIFVSKSYNAVSKLFEKRNGDEIYLALFGKQVNSCVRVLNVQDQTIPKIDYAIWLHFETCPEECKRILTEFEYDRTEIYANTLSKESLKENNISWWNLSELGDTIIKYEYTIIEGKNIRTLWLSTDSTKVYCRDIYD